ncbi:uncharacterized protein LOC144159825 [Haemaphysalis longicornis]
MLDCEAVRPSLSLCAASRAEMITHAYVRYVDDRTCAVVSITDIKDFAPKDTEDFPVTPLLVSWTDENGATDFYRARVLLLAAPPQPAVLSRSSENVQHDPGVPMEDLVDIGQGVKIRREVWTRIERQPKDSLYVKELLVAIWEPSTLLNRSLFGKHSPRFPGRPRKDALTPKKVEVLRGKCTDKNYNFSDSL